MQLLVPVRPGLPDVFHRAEEGDQPRAILHPLGRRRRVARRVHVRALGGGRLTPSRQFVHRALDRRGGAVHVASS